MRLHRLLAVASISGFALVAAERAPEATRTVQTVVRSALSDAITQYKVALPHLAVGGTWRTQIVIGNNSSSAADVSLYYFGDNGNPLDLTFGGVAADHTTVSVPAYGEQIVEPDWQSSAETSGWVGIVYTTVGVKIQGIFLWHNPADPADKYTEAAGPVIDKTVPACILPMPVPVNSSTTMPFDETENRLTGYGFANSTSTAATLTLTVYDQSGQQLAQYSKQLAAFGHESFLLKDRVSGVVGKKGIVLISGDGIVPLGLRFTPYYTFMTLQP